MSNDFASYNRKFKRNDIERNQVCNQEHGIINRNGRNINYFYNSFVNIYNNMINNDVLRQNNKCKPKRKLSWNN